MTMRVRSTRPTRRRGDAVRRPGFTLVELVVVAAIVLVLLAVVLPSARSMWAERNQSNAENVLSGVLRNARRQAMVAGRGESGLLFALNAAGVQMIYAIERIAQPTPPGFADLELASQHRFAVLDERSYTLPPPMRVVPRYVIKEPSGGQPDDDPDAFSAEELANDVFPDPPDAFNEAQRHRNFFTMVFSRDGHLIVGRDVLIYDKDENRDFVGDRTGLRVGLPPRTHQVGEYHPQDDLPRPIDPTGGGATLENLVTDDTGRAINLPSVDGVLLYDESLFGQYGAPEQKRDYLLQAAVPFYVNRLTGAVIQGPAEENVAP